MHKNTGDRQAHTTPKGNTQTEQDRARGKKQRNVRTKTQKQGWPNQDPAQKGKQKRGTNPPKEEGHRKTNMRQTHKNPKGREQGS